MDNHKKTLRRIEKAQKLEREKQLQELAIRLGIAENIELVKYLTFLHKRIDDLKIDIASINSQIYTGR